MATSTDEENDAEADGIKDYYSQLYKEFTSELRPEGSTIVNHPINEGKSDGQTLADF